MLSARDTNPDGTSRYQAVNRFLEGCGYRADSTAWHSFPSPKNRRLTVKHRQHPDLFPLPWLVIPARQAYHQCNGGREIIEGEPKHG